MRSLYRSKTAQDLHTAILGCIFGRNKVSVVSNLWHNSNSSVLKEKSINGFTHLMDVYHLSHQIYKYNTDIANLKIRFLSNIMLSDSTDNTVKKYLLLETNDQNINPLHDLLNNGDLSSFISYINKVKHLKVLGFIKLSEYKRLLTQPSLSGFTPLHIAANLDSYHLFIKFYSELTAVLSPIELNKSLMAKTSFGFIPRCQTFKSSHEKINSFLNQQRMLIQASIAVSKPLLFIRTIKAGKADNHKLYQKTSWRCTIASTNIR